MQIIKNKRKFPKDIIIKVGTYNFTFKEKIKNEKYVNTWETQVIRNPILLMQIIIFEFMKFLRAPFFGKVIIIIIMKKYTTIKKCFS